MAVSCPEVMYGAYYPYLYGRAGPSRSFYQYERFNQDLYSSSGVPLAASSSASGSSHSPCSPILPSSVTANAAAIAAAASHNVAAASTTIPTLPIGSSGGGSGSNSSIHSRTIQTKEEDISTGAIIGSHHNDSSCSSGPDSPHHHGGGNGGGASSSKEHHLDGSSTGRAQYISASCVVFTHYTGDTASVVDEHFSRALNFSNKDSKETSSPMSARNFPPSFWNSNYVPPAPVSTHPQFFHNFQVSDLYSADGSYTTDPWVPHAAHYGSYAHAAHAHAAHAHAYHHANMAQYGSLLRLPQQYGHGTRLHHDQQTAHALESAAAYSSYPTMAGLEAQVQESSKDLYWF
ncbi:protein vestigial isoform X3 [Condylostylus longicornis]|uniref:protein vestigial isoform X3 n=1 Tax=Condylostylus longicornis TaxID=2530218 RepID=UPI00244E33BB|nr:protein vestigial isoform X3 [Condylostylus longicornis]